jgi:TATA-box binding
MRSKWLTLTLVLIILNTFIVASAPAPVPEQTLTHFFLEMGAQPEQYVLHHGGRIAQMIEGRRVGEWTDRLRQALGLLPARREVEGDGLRWTASGWWGRNQRVELTVINDEPKQHWIQPYVSIRINGWGRPDAAFFRARQYLIDRLEQQGIAPKFHFSIQGYQEWPPAKKEQWIQQALKRMRAREVEALRTAPTTSVSCYSPLFPDGLNTQGGVMNLQVAARIDRLHHRIAVTMGTPIITIEY